MIGSSICAPALENAALNAENVAILNATSDESTSWYDPKYGTTFTLMIGYPAKIPCAIVSFAPLSIAGINSLGIDHPLTSDSKI